MKTGLTREQLLEKKIKLDAAVQAARADLQEAKRTAAATGVFLPPSELRRLEDHARGLGRASQRLQLELAKISKEEKARNISKANDEDRAFVAAAKRRLDPVLFHDLLEEAREEVGRG